MFIVMDYLALDFQGVCGRYFSNSTRMSGRELCWVCADTSKNNVEQSGNQMIGTNVSGLPFEGKTKLPLNSYFDAAKGHISNVPMYCKFLYWTRERRSLLCEQKPWNLIHIHLLWSFITLRLTNCTAFPFFLLTLPFPMSRHLSQPGDTGNAFYCNTSILSVLSLLLPPLVLRRPAVLSAPEYSREDLLWRHDRGEVSASWAVGRMFSVYMQNKPTHETYLKCYNKNNVPPEFHAQLCIFSSRCGELDKSSMY